MSSITKTPFEQLEDAPLGEEFLAFMDQNFSQNAGRYNDIRDWMQGDLSSESERILASFTLVATGCFNRGNRDIHVAERVIEELETIGDLSDPTVKKTIAGNIQETLEAIDSDSSRWDWLHGHRKNIHFDFSNAGSSVADSLSGLAEVVGGHRTLGDYFDANIQSEEDPFYSIFKDVKGISGFGRLSAFNFLELTDTTGDIDGLTPRVPRFDYIRTANPKPGFFYVFVADGPEDDTVWDLDWDDASQLLGVDEDGLDALVGLLCEAAENRLGWNSDVVMYDVESCLCIFAKKPEHRTLVFGGDHDDRRSNRSGC